MRPFSGKFFELRLSNMRPHEVTGLSRLGVRAFIRLLFGAGGRAFGQEPSQARHYVSPRLFPECGKNVVRTGPPPVPVLLPLPHPRLSTALVLTLKAATYCRLSRILRTSGAVLNLELKVEIEIQPSNHPLHFPQRTLTSYHPIFVLTGRMEPESNSNPQRTALWVEIRHFCDPLSRLGNRKSEL